MSYGWIEILVHAGAFLITALILHGLYWLFCRVKGKQYKAKGNLPLFLVAIVCSTLSASFFS